jgi:hypothetical protein
MKKTLSLVIFSVLLLTLSLTLCACGTVDPIVGEWGYDQTISISIRDNKTLTYTNKMTGTFSGTWEFDSTTQRYNLTIVGFEDKDIYVVLMNENLISLNTGTGGSDLPRK